MSAELQTQTIVDTHDELPLDDDDDLSDVELEEDRSSSLSEIEDKDGEPEPEDDAEISDDLSNPSDDNDSEAETERLEESPHKLRVQKDVILNSHNGSETYERSPSKLHKQIIINEPEDDEDDADADAMSDDDISAPNDSPKSSSHDNADHEPATTAATSLEDSSGEGKRTLSTSEIDSRKRKRSIMAGSGLDNDLGEPLPKRTGSVINPSDEYAIDDEDRTDETNPSNPISGNISGDDGEEALDEALLDVAEEVVADDENAELADVPISPKKRGRKKKKPVENGVHIEDDLEVLQNGSLANGEEDTRNGGEEIGDNDADDEEAELALKNEEELEKKTNALDQLSGIEKNFAVFRDRLFDERMEQLNREEAMLRQDEPTHPTYLVMKATLDARHEERARIAERTREYELQTLKRSAVARRSQIIVQYRQDAREIRETKMEQLGKQWYEIQHERRTHPSGVPEYTLNYPARRSQQVQNQVAYANEVSILSGIAKNVGFPAAPPMAQASDAELEDDFERMGQRTRHQIHQPATMPLQELAALRTAGSTSRFKPAEEQFIEQTPWANPQHPSHAHFIHRQTSAQQTPRTTSPLSQVQVQPRRHSHQQGGGPISGSFSNTPTSLLQHTNGYMMSGGRVSPHNPFSNSHSHTIVPSPLGSRQPSLSPKQTRPPLPQPNASIEEQNHQYQHTTNNQNHQAPRIGLPDVISELAGDPPTEGTVPKREFIGRF